MKLKQRFLSLAYGLLLATSVSTAWADSPKYVFFFLGDGMSSAQIQATEAYLTTVNGGSAAKATDLMKIENRLNMCRMPVQGMQTTYDAHALMTDSASAGTAFACGIKTNSGVIGMDETMSVSFKSVAELAQEKGKKVGIISSVSLDHATPASYYASVANRGYMNRIATQLTETDYHFFGGGGFASPQGPARSGDSGNNIWDLLKKKGYTVVNDRNAMMSLKKKPRDKVVCINPWLQDSAAMPYAIDRPNTNLSLKEMTEVAVSCLANGRGRHGRNDGFFLMVEGGKIDWACHANDAMAAIGDMIDFDEAVGVALNFYRKYPQDTLIVVTGDHETGGMSIGHATTGYAAYYDRILGQTNSFTYFGQKTWPVHKTAYAKNYDWTDAANLSGNPAMLKLMNTEFGLNWNELNAYQKQKLEDAYDKSMCGTNRNGSDENKLLYGGYEPIVVTITHVLNEQASIGWTSYSHTGVPVPVFAAGVQAGRFGGFYDNTDIAKKLARIMNVREPLPVRK